MSMGRTILGVAALLVLAAVAMLAWRTGGPERPRAAGARSQHAGAPAPGAERIAALSPAIAATLRDLGLADRLVARHAWDAWSDPSLPVGGDQSGIDYETLLRVAPTHVLLEWGGRPLPARLDDVARARAWTVRDMSALTLEDVAARARALAEAFGAADSPVLARLDEGWTPRPLPEPVVRRLGRVLLLADAAPPAALGPGSAHAQLLRGLGCTPAITEGAPYINLDAEDLVRLAPDTIVLVRPRPARAPRDPGADAGALAALGPLAALPLPGVRTGRVAILDDPESLLPGTPLLRFADDLRAVLERLGADGAPGS